MKEAIPLRGSCWATVASIFATKEEPSFVVDTPGCNSVFGKNLSKAVGLVTLHEQDIHVVNEQKDAECLEELGKVSDSKLKVEVESSVIPKVVVVVVLP